MIRTVVVLEWAIFVIGALLILTQIVIPAVRGRPLFPLLRSKGLRLETDIATAREDKEFKAHERELGRLRPKPTQPTQGEPNV